MLKPIAVKLPQETIDAIDEEGRENERSRSQQIRIIVKKHYIKGDVQDE